MCFSPFSILMKGEEMKKQEYLQKNGFFAENEKFILQAPSEKYKEDYLSLCLETSIMPNAYKEENFRELSWKDVYGEDLYLFIIDKNTGEFCGNLMLKHLEEDTPEIGIDLLKRFQNQGIGYQMVKLLMETANRIQPVKYFLVRIYSDNLRSQNLFRKFGAVPIGTEESHYAKLLRKWRSCLDEEELQKLHEKNEMVEIEEQKYIIHYKVEIS